MTVHVSEPAPIVVKTTCPYCGVGCGVLATPDGEGGAAIAGDPEHPANFGRLCSKGSALGETLSLDDRLTARALVGLLAAAWSDPDLQLTLRAALPVAGVNGTLEDRMERAPARGVVRAKTGTTARASALSGYVGDRYAFAVIQNGWPVSYSSARRAQDRFATALASALGQ